MAQTRQPEDVLYAFSQWLQQWADYALSQAEKFATTSSLSDQAGAMPAAESPPMPQKYQPPAHWLELGQSEPPPHWLALFEEYGLEPPKTDASPGDVEADSQMRGSCPRPLQEWLGEFQRDLAQFAQQPDSHPRDSHPVESAAVTTSSVPDRTPSADPPLPQGQRDDSQVNAPAPETRIDPANIPEQEGGIARSTPVRLRLNPQPPVPAFSPLPDMGENTRPAFIQPAQAASHPMPRLFVGVPARAGKPLSAKPAPLVESIGESSRSEPVHPLTSFVATENTLPRVKPVEADLLMETDRESIHPPIRRREDALLSSSSRGEQEEQSPLEWSQPPAAHWPELPDRLPPVQPPSNVLADLAHRMRINREQRGRSWNT